MKKLFPVFAVSAVAILCTFHGYSQCKRFAKKDCMPKLTPYIHNGQLNSTTLMQGESAELIMTFHSGQKYRVLVCGDNSLGKLQFQLMDTERNVIFDSKKQNDPEYWDFEVNATQRFIILVSSPKPGKHAGAQLPGALVQSGCVALLVGFKE